MEQKLETYLVFEDYYDKKFGEKVRAIPGYKIIEHYWNCSEPAIFGHRISKHSSPSTPQYVFFRIEDVGLINDTDYLIVRTCSDIEIMNKDVFKMLYTKNKRIANKFLKIEKEFSSEYVELNTIKEVYFVKKDNEEYISITYRTGWSIISPENILNYDEVEEILKNYVEE